MKKMIRSLVVFSLCIINAHAQSYKFDFGVSSVPAVVGYTKVTTANLYTKTYANDNVVGYYGFENWDSTHLRGLDRVNPSGLNRDIITGWNNNGFSSFYFSVNVPEGKYTVTFYIGDYSAAATTTIKAESRRLLVENLETAAGQIVTRTFTVMRKDPAIGTTGTSVGLDYSYGREDPAICLGWDRKLTFEFSGTRPAIGGIDIVKVDTCITLHLCGNSTLVEQEDVPWAAWGQSLHRFFNSSIIVNDLATSGLTSSSFLNQRRLAKICSVMRPGDYLFFEFGHNDQGSVSTSQFQTNMKRFSDSALAHGATMVFVAPTARRADNDSATSVGGYAELTRTYARTLGAKLIDLNTAVIRMKAALGAAAYGSDDTQLYCNVSTSPLWPDQPAVNDGTHFCDFGGYELAKWVAKTGMKAAGLTLTQYLLDTATFNPNTPDSKSNFHLPVSLDTVFRHTTPGATVRPDSTSAVTTQVLNATGELLSGYSISINPVMSTIAYTVHAGENAMFDIFSITGKMLARKHTASVKAEGAFQWKEINGLPAGIYYLQMKVNSKDVRKTRFCKL
jgi:hypothetical protein